MPKLEQRKDFFFVTLRFLSVALAGFWVCFSATNNWAVNLAAFAMLVAPTLAIFQAVESPQAGPVAIGFWSLQLVWISIASWYQISTKQFPWADGNVEALILPAQLLSLTAFAAFWLGYRGLTFFAQNVPSETPVGKKVRSSLYPLIGATALLPLVITGSGGIANRFLNRETVSAQIALASSGNDSIYIFFIDRLPAAFVTVSLFLVAREFRFRETEKRFSAWRALWAFALAVVIVNPFSSPRFISLSAVVAFFIGVVDFSSRRWRAIFSWVSILGMAVVYPLSSWFKKQNIQTNGVQVDVNAFAGIDFDGFQMAMNAISYTGDQGVQWGKHIFSSLLFFIPRSIWPSKAEVSTYDIAYSRGYLWGNLSLPLWAELYLDLGIIGCVVGVFWLARLAGSLDKSIGLNGSRAVIGGIVAATSWGFLRGPLGAQVIFFGTALAIAIALRTNEADDTRQRFKPKRKNRNL